MFVLHLKICGRRQKRVWIKNSKLRKIVWLGFRIQKEEWVRCVSDLCVPEIYQSDILKLCHDVVSGHLGSCKTEDMGVRNFFLAKLLSTDRRVCKNL